MDESVHAAVRSGDIEKLKGLLEAGADPNALDSRGMTPLMHAANLRALRDGTVEALIAAGADITLVTPDRLNFFQFLLRRDENERGSGRFQLSEKFDLLRQILNRRTEYDIVEPLEGVPYVGRILAVNDEYALCIQASNHQIVLHDTSRLERIPQPDDLVRISYGLFCELAVVKTIELAQDRSIFL